MRQEKRMWWPVFVWAAALITFVGCGLAVAGIWVDGRFGKTAALLLGPWLVALIAAGVTAEEKATYTVRPRGWRKIRRDAEREAYIDRLEREMGIGYDVQG